MIRLTIILVTCLISNFTLALEKQTFGEQIEAQIAKELAIKDVYVIFNGSQKTGDGPTEDIQDLYLNYDDRTFSLVLKKDKSTQVTGKFDDAVYVAVLRDTFNKNHMITADDIMLKKAPNSILKAKMIIHEEELINKILAKKIKKGAAIFKHDLKSN